MLEITLWVLGACVVYLAGAALLKKLRTKPVEEVIPEKNEEVIIEALGTFDAKLIKVEEPIIVVETPAPVATATVAEKKPRAPRKPKPVAPSTIEVSTISKSGTANTETSNTSFQSQNDANNLFNGIIIGSVLNHTLQNDSATATHSEPPTVTTYEPSTPSYDSSSSDSSSSSSSYDSGSSSSFDSGSSGGGE